MPHTPRRGVARTVTERTLARRLTRARSRQEQIALTGILVDRRTSGPIHLELEEDAYAGIACWLGSDHWTEVVVKAVFTSRYPQIRPLLVAATGGGVSLKAVLAVAQAMAAAASFQTGRGSRLAVDTIAARTGLGRRTVQRARSALLMLRVATEILPGRIRTRAERLASWAVGDRSRGWASVWALHPPHPVDNVGNVIAGQHQMAPHPTLGIFWSLISCKRVLFTGKAVENAAASRRLAMTKGRGRPQVDRGGQLLAAQWLRDRRTPAWARPLSVGQWAPVLAEAAGRGFTGADLNTLLDEEARRLGRELTPEHPIRFLRWLLGKTDLDFPPHVLDAIARDQEASARAAAAEHTRVMLEQGQRKRAVALADLDGPGRAAARAAARAVGDRCGQTRPGRTS
ncbi:replication protein [Rhodococcus marinonascens]|uniref:replication protein n=1 Tax=Rhodococcus marinonascens TaxID=38311 RepID=UPI000AF6DF8B|nr:replication protein [Rhodococcus marinonascens]